MRVNANHMHPHARAVDAAASGFTATACLHPDQVGVVRAAYAPSAEEVERALREAGVPVGRVLNVRDIVENEHTKARGLVEDVWVPKPKPEHAEAEGTRADGTEGDGGWSVKMSKVVPVLEGCDAKTRWAGPELGQHNREVLIGELGLPEEEFARLQEQGVIGK